MKYVVTDNDVDTICTKLYQKYPIAGGDEFHDDLREAIAQTLGDPVAVHQAVFTGTLDGRHVGLYGNLESVAVLQTYVERKDKAGEPVAVPDAVVAGALFDFLGFLTSRDEPVTFSGSHFAGTAVEVLREWNEKRGLNLNEADVTNWRSMLYAAPHHPTTEKGCE